MSTMDEMNSVFRQEAEELLNEIEETILELEDDPHDREAVNRLFRAVHTIKGSGAMFGYNSLVDFTHHLETVLDRLRDGEIDVTKELIDIILSSRDHIKTLLDHDEAKGPADSEEGKRLVAFLSSYLSESALDSFETEPDIYEDIEENGEETTYRIRFIPGKNIFQNGTDPFYLLEEISSLGHCMITSMVDHIPLLNDLDPEECYISWDMILTTDKSYDIIKDVFIFVEDDCELVIEEIDTDNFSDDSPGNKKIGEILVERHDLSIDAVNEALGDQKRLGEILVDHKLVDKDKVKSALTEQNYIKEINEKRNEETKASTLRVASEKLDTLVALVGELVTVQARLAEHPSLKGDSDLTSISEEVGRLTDELRDNTMSIRMLPIGTTFSKFKRLVRDLSNKLGKKILLVTEGGETELDKTVIEKLNDPLVHIIRNSIDHGIEDPEKRLAAGKPEQGRVLLSASHSGGNVLIKITDDGAGLNPEKILAKAVDKGIVPTDADLSEKEIAALIFEPGFSTAGSITDISGRGVGMDVVRRSIESLRGTIDIDNRVNEGMTIKIKLPLTLAIIDGLVVDVCSEYFILPVSAIEECVELTHQEASLARKRNIIDFRGNVIPYLSLREIFDLDDDYPEIEKVIIADINGEAVGFGVDNLIGQNQVVIKTMGKLYKNLKGFSGATILGDGTIALILDIAQLIPSSN